jgi:hypothetical protein
VKLPGLGFTDILVLRSGFASPRATKTRTTLSRLTIGCHLISFASPRATKTGTTLSTSSGVLDGSWHLITYVEDGTSYSVYVDGVLDFTDTINNYFIWGQHEQIVFGAAFCGHDEFTGDFAYLSLHNVAHSQNEVAEYYQILKNVLIQQSIALP